MFFAETLGFTILEGSKERRAWVQRFLLKSTQHRSQHVSWSFQASPSRTPRGEEYFDVFPDPTHPSSREAAYGLTFPPGSLERSPSKRLAEAGTKGPWARKKGPLRCPSLDFLPKRVSVHLGSRATCPEWHAGALVKL